jgi:hypothetical protein
LAKADDYNVLHLASGVPAWTDSIQLGGTLQVDGVTTLNDNIDMSGASSDILIPDNQAQAFEIKEGTAPYLRFVTTNGGEQVRVHKAFWLNDNVDIFPTTTTCWLGGSSNYFGRAYLNDLYLGGEVETDLTMAAAKHILFAASSSDIGTEAIPGRNFFCQGFAAWKDNAQVDCYATCYDGSVASRTARFNLRRARGTYGSEAAVQSGDYLGWFTFYGHDGTDFVYTASVLCTADENFSGSQSGSKMSLFTTEQGYTSPTEKLRLTSDGGVEVRGGYALRLRDVGDSHSIIHKAPALTADSTYTWPTTVDAGKYLKTDGSGNLSWDTPAGGSSVVTTGAVMDTIKSTADTGWVLAQGGTIGSATSGASERANADCEDLFKMLWDEWSDSEAPVVGGRGASADADWTANKKITLPDTRRRYRVGVGTSPWNTLGANDGVAEGSRQPDTHGHANTFDTDNTDIDHAHSGGSTGLLDDTADVGGSGTDVGSEYHTHVWGPTKMMSDGGVTTTHKHSVSGAVTDNTSHPPHIVFTVQIKL